jgi:phosphatidylserine/phosphatidylglycerophosphate/cardiolipin synthase-like enzyme
MANIDRARLARIAAEVSTIQGAQALGTFRPERMPQIPLPAAPFRSSGSVSAVSPDCSYRLLSDVLNSAERTLLIYVYEIAADYLIDLVTKAHDRGVDIRLMYDHGGTHAADREVLEALPVSVKPAPSFGGRGVFTVCHQKFVVADGKTVVVESANWAKTSIPEIEPGDPYKKGNREWLIRIDDRDVAGFFTGLFDADWNIPDLGVGAGLVAPLVEPPGLMVPAELAATPQQTFDLFPFSQQVELMPIISPINYFDAVDDLLQSATSSIDLQQQYITAGDKVDDLLETVAKRRDAGCTIRIIVSPAFPKAWNATVDTLDAVGLKDCLKALNLRYFTHCHNKGVIVDRKKVVVSSTNWSANSITKAREAGLIVGSPDVTKYYAGVFDEDWAEGIAADDVKKRLLDVGTDEII